MKIEDLSEFPKGARKPLLVLCNLVADGYTEASNLTDKSLAEPRPSTEELKSALHALMQEDLVAGGFYIDTSDVDYTIGQLEMMVKCIDRDRITPQPKPVAVVPPRLPRST